MCCIGVPFHLEFGFCKLQQFFCSRLLPCFQRCICTNKCKRKLDCADLVIQLENLFPHFLAKKLKSLKKEKTSMKKIVQNLYQELLVCKFFCSFTQSF